MQWGEPMNLSNEDKKQVKSDTHQRTTWVGDKGPISFSPSHKHWKSPKSYIKKFLCVDIRNGK